jgi:hypothetical protein
MNPVLLFSLWCLGGFIVGVVFGSFFEWALHRYVMHRPIWNFRYAFQAHAVVHHQVFKADQTYHLQNEKDKETIPMAWWNGPVLIAIGVVPFALISWLVGEWGFTAGGFLAFSIYYGTYEYIHWCMHLPKVQRGLTTCRLLAWDADSPCKNPFYAANRPFRARCAALILKTAVETAVFRKLYVKG